MLSFQATHRIAIAGGRTGELLRKIICWSFYLHSLPNFYSFVLCHMQAVLLLSLAVKMTDSVLLKNVMVPNPDLQPKASVELSHGSHLPAFGPASGRDTAWHMHGWQQLRLWCPLSLLLIVSYRLISSVNSYLLSTELGFKMNFKK